MTAAAATAAGTPLRRRFVDVGERQVHLRTGGHGPAVVLLHEMPLSSRTLVDLGGRLAERFTVLALDLPGYGSSDPLALAQPEIADYADALAATLTALGVERCSVYGAKSGAQVALELTRRHPQRVTAAVLDGLLLIDDAQRRELLAEYLPAFPPALDGSHLAALWARHREQFLFFPWYKRANATRLDGPVPAPEVLHEGVLDFLRAGAGDGYGDGYATGYAAAGAGAGDGYGDGYATGYAAAFRHDVAAALAEARAPATIVAREGDLLEPQLERLPALPPAVAVERLPADPPAAAERIAALLARDGERVPAPAIPAPSPHAARVVRSYCDTSHGQLLVRHVGGGPRRPLLMLHASPGSAAMLVGLARLLGRNRPVVLLDTIGNGDSDKPAWRDAPAQAYAEVAAEAVDRLGLGEFDLYGTHTGALIAAELAILRPRLIARAVLHGVLIFDEAERADHLAHYTPAFAPRPDGTHLLAAWSALRDQTLFYPWYDRTRAGIRWVEPIAAGELARWYLELLKSGETYPLGYRAAFSYPTRERLPLLGTETLMIASVDDMLHDATHEAARLAPAARAQTVREDDADVARAIEEFLA